MSKETPETTEKSKSGKSRPVTFKCQSCGKDVPIEEMRMVERFFPMLIVCQSCKEQMR